MKDRPILIVMLTKDDCTVGNAYDIFESSKACNAEYWGLKEKGLPLPQMKELYAYMKSMGKSTVLEVVAYTEDMCMEGAGMAAECGCDILMGTVFFDSVNEFCKEHGIKYMPFVGNVSGRPSVLEGDIESILAEAEEYIKKGAYGIDLLGYRYTGDNNELNRSIVSRLGAPVCIAGSINTRQRLDSIREISPWAYTVGSAFFEDTFGNSFSNRIDAVLSYMSCGTVTADA